jgi:hypothetical protein
MLNMSRKDGRGIMVLGYCTLGSWQSLVSSHQLAALLRRKSKTVD